MRIDRVIFLGLVTRMTHDHSDEKKQMNSGCLHRLAKWFIKTMLIALSLVVVLIFIPQDISDIAVADHSRELLPVFQNSVKGEYEVKISEGELNAYLKKTLALQGVDQVLVRLEDGRTEIILVKKIFGRNFTESIFLRVEQMADLNGSMHHDILLDGGKFPGTNMLKGGRLGRLTLPQGFIRLYLSSFDKLASVLKQEIHHGIEEMITVKFQPDELVLDPKLPAETGMGL